MFDAIASFADLDSVSEVRGGVGMLAAVELSDEVLAAEPKALGTVVLTAREAGVLIRPLAKAVAISPPLTATEEHFGADRSGDRAWSLGGGVGSPPIAFVNGLAAGMARGRVHFEAAQRGDRMASVSQQTPVQTNGGTATATIGVENPATGELITTIPVLGTDEIAEMAKRARAAQPAWEAMGFEARGRIMRRAQKWMLDNADRVIDVVVSESGKTHEDAQLADLGYTVSALGFWAKEAEKYLADERVPSWNNPVAAGKKLIIRYAPVGVAGIIGPWNYPIANSFGDCIPAMMAGNSVILKPSEVTPLSSLLMQEMMIECGLPEDVFQIATGDGSTGAALIRQVDVIMFTGSSRTGRAVMKEAADALIPCYLELGGKDPMIVCRDADIERAANAAVVLLDEQRRPGVHLGRARVRRGAGLRRVRAKGDRQHPPAPSGRAVRRRLGRHRRGHVPAAGRHHRQPRQGRGREGGQGPRRRSSPVRARAASTSRRCSSTSITRCRA